MKPVSYQQGGATEAERGVGKRVKNPRHANGLETKKCEMRR